MKKAFFLILLTLCTSMTFAQKVKIKKDAVLIDEVLTYKVEEAGSVQILSSLSGKEFLVITSNSYQDDEDEIRIGGKSWVYTLRFMDSGEMMYTDIRPKEIIAKVFNSKMVEANGTIEAKKLEDFINKYNNAKLKGKL